MLIGGVAVARSVMMPTVLLLAAMFSTSLYFTFRDSFRLTTKPHRHRPTPGDDTP